MSHSIELADALDVIEQLDINSQAELVAELSRRLSAKRPTASNPALDEPELPDPGRIRMPSRNIQDISASVRFVGRLPIKVRVASDEA